MAVEIHELFLRASVGAEENTKEASTENTHGRNHREATMATRATEQMMDVINRKNER